MYRNSIIFKTVSVLLITVMVSVTIVPIPVLAQQQQDSYSQGRLDGERDAEGDPAWILTGLLCGIVGVGAAYFLHSPSPPSGALVGKSSDYVLGYTEGYQKEEKRENANYACIGAASWVLIALVLIDVEE